MPVFKVPTSSGENVFPNYQMEVELDEVVYRLELLFNSRQLTWFMNLRDANGAILRSGTPIVSGFPLYKRMKQITKPDGTTMAVPVSGIIDAAGLEQLGTDVILTYTGES
jgi:hypothetical protein